MHHTTINHNHFYLSLSLSLSLPAELLILLALCCFYSVLDSQNLVLWHWKQGKSGILCSWYYLIKKRKKRCCQVTFFFLLLSLGDKLTCFSHCFNKIPVSAWLFHINGSSTQNVHIVVFLLLRQHLILIFCMFDLFIINTEKHLLIKSHTSDTLYLFSTEKQFTSTAIARCLVQIRSKGYPSAQKTW